MSQDEIHQIAQADTPNGVDVPNTLTGLVAWGFMRFGTNVMLMMIAVGILSFAIQNVYEDSKQTNRVVLDMVRAQTESSVKLSSALSELSKQVENNTATINGKRWQNPNP